MAKYLIHASYSAEGTRGLIKDGASRRRSAVEDLVKSIGGKLEGFYYAFGETDGYAIVDVPDSVSAAAFSLAINASGLLQTKTTVLLTAEEMDQAIRKSATYRPPGQ